MKRNILIYALCALFAFNFTSCKNEEPEEKTDHEIRKEILEAKKGWTLQTATSSPAYNLNDGGTILNLFDGFIYPCEADDVIFFEHSGAQMLDPNKNLCDNEEKRSLGNWSLSEDGKILKYYLPQYDGYLLEATIVTIDENSFTVQMKVNEEEPEVSKGPGKYTFTMTYKKN